LITLTDGDKLLHNEPRHTDPWQFVGLLAQFVNLESLTIFGAEKQKRFRAFEKLS